MANCSSRRPITSRRDHDIDNEVRMRIRLSPLCLLLVLTLWTLSLPSPSCWAATSINNGNQFGWGANIGWVNWRGDTNNGAVIGEYVCSGDIYAANVGWINLGNGAPLNGIQYQNASANDFGVNQDGVGNLRGYAYAANVGWISFENQGAPRVDLQSGQLTGWIYSANCGWIGLSNAWAVVQTDTIAAGVDADGNGLPDAWELVNFGHTGVDPNGDPDGDGMSNRQEYLAGTNPNDRGDKLVIISFGASMAGKSVEVTWQSEATRRYYIETKLGLTSATWEDSGLGLITPDGPTTTRTWSPTGAAMRFYRVRAVRPLAP
jgi:hypothetical protein